MKSHIRVLGIDDGPFDFSDDRALFAAVLFRLPSYIEAIALGTVEVDGRDSSDSIRQIVERKGWKHMLHAIMIDGAALGGFNIVDIKALSVKTGIPSITVTSERPDMKSIKEALKGHFQCWEYRYAMLESRELHEIRLDEGAVYVSFEGTDLKNAVEIVKKSVIRGLTPEPIRIAHMVAGACASFRREVCQWGV